VNPDITINIGVSPVDGSVAASRQEETTGAAPSPMDIAELQSVAMESAPSPVAPGTLEEAATVEDAGAPPPPMDVLRLQGLAAGDGPEPVEFGALQDVSSAPAPTLETIDTAAGGGKTPEPMALEDLESASGDAKGRGPKK
jgi:hypothetical protein